MSSGSGHTENGTTPQGGPTMDVASLAELLREAEQHHGAYEATAAKHHWSGWYEAYITARIRGGTPTQAFQDAVRSSELEPGADG